ncbi:MAG: hypothetical protein RLN62_05290 [Rickettsiales bacterium]
MSESGAGRGAKLNNAALLDQNEIDVEEKVKDYLGSSVPPDSDEVTAGAGEIIKDASRALSGMTAIAESSYGDETKRMYSAAIYELQRARDAKQGIKWNLSEPHRDGTRSLIRDARSITGGIDTKSPESFVISYLNVARAAEVMLDQTADIKGVSSEEVQIKRKQIRLRSAELLKQLESSAKIGKEVIQDLNQQLVTDLSSIKGADGKSVFKDTEKTLDRAKSLTQLDDEHFHTTTISTAKDSEGRDKTVVESEVMCLGSTEEMRTMYENIANGSKHPSWYTRLKPEQQRLVKKYAKELGEGKKILSSQMFNFVPGMKNAYLKVVSVKKEGEPLKLKKVAKILHCGTPSFHGKSDKAAMTKWTIAQARSFADRGDGKSLEFALHTLNSGTQPTGPESEIVRELMAAVAPSAGKKSNVELDRSAVNFFRRMSQSSHGFTDSGLKRLATIIKTEGTKLPAEQFAKVTTIANFVEHGETMPWYQQIFFRSDKLKAKEAIKDLITKDPELAKIASAGFRLKEARESQKSWFSFRNTNFDISTSASLVDHAINVHGAAGEPKRKKFYFCKSGKDRTGSVTFKSTHIALCDTLGFTTAALQGGDAARDAARGANDNIVRLADAGSAQFMAGVAGATVGSHGILPHTPKQLFTSEEQSLVADRLGLKTSKLNKVKTRKTWISRDSVAEDILRAAQEAGKPAREAMAAAADENKFEVDNPLHAARKSGRGPRAR